MKKGVFPYLGEGLQSTSDNIAWDGVSGFIKTSAQVTVAFNVDNYNDPKNDKPVIESGQSVLVVAGATTLVSITGGQAGIGEDGDNCALAAGDSVCVMYHEEHGFVFLGGSVGV